MRGVLRFPQLGTATLLVIGLGISTYRCDQGAGRGLRAPPGDAPPAWEAVRESARASLARLPLRFEDHRVAGDPRPRFVHRAPGCTLSLTPDGAVLDLAGKDRRALLRTRLAGSTPAPAMTGEEALPGRTHYLRGSDPSVWRTGIASYGKVRCAGVYPGVDLVYHGTEGVLEYDFVVAPGADPGRIALDIQGADDLAIDAGGDLVLATPAGEVRQHAPRVYQEVADARVAVEGRYALRGDGRVGFEVGAYDADRTLVIDPTLVFATYLGGDSRDIPYGIALGADGSIFVAGDTLSGDFASASAFDTTFSGWGDGNQYGTYYASGDAFVSKLNADGTAVAWTTYLGGAANDAAFGIAVDAAGSAYVTGRTFSENFPTTAGAFQAADPDDYYNYHDAFVTKLAPDGGSLVYSTYLGGTYHDYGFDIAVDGSGNAFVTGQTWSENNFPTVGQIPGVHQAAYNAVFVTKVAADGASLVYSSLLGGDSNADAGLAIAVDSSGSAVVAGGTGSTNFPTTAGAQQAARAGSYDGFLFRVNPAGSALVFSTYFGGSGSDGFNDVALDASGNAFLAGESDSTDFPVTAGAYRTTKGIYTNSTVTKFDATGALVYATFLGYGSATGIAVDGAGRATVAGYTSWDAGVFPLVNPLFDTPEGTWNGTVSRLDASGSSLLYSTYFGYGGGYAVGGEAVYSGKHCRSIALDAAGVAVTAGPVVSVLLGTPGAAQESPPPDVNAIVLKINPLSAPAAPTGLLASAVSGSRIDLSWIDNSPEEEAYEVERSVAGGAFAPLAAEVADAVGYASQGLEPLRTYAHRVRATNAAGNSAWSAAAEATTLATLDLAVLKGKASDSATEQKDGFQAKGTLAFNGNSADGAFDPAEDAVDLEFGDEDDPATLAIPAGDPGWKAKNGKFTWKSPKGALPKAKVVIDTAKGTFSLSVKGFDFEEAPAGTVQVLLRCGDDAGRHQAPWTEKKPGLLVTTP